MASSSKLTTYKFIFYAKISKFSMNAKVTSPIFITWKRSNHQINIRPGNSQIRNVRYD